MDRDRLDAWLRAYGRAWETRDADALASLFTEDAAYRETPFDEPAVGYEAIRAYWLDQVVERQRDIAFGYEILTSDPPIARWWASFARAAGGRARLDGVFLLRFDDDRCADLREWWHWREEA